MVGPERHGMHPIELDTASDGADVRAIAAEALAVLGTGDQVAPFSTRFPGFRLDDAYRVTATLRELREARGEQPLGRKIGFTNRTIWDEYNVHAPIWGYVYDTTVQDLAESGTTFRLNGLSEPRIEPEIMFGLAETPAPGMDEHALLGCIEWVAHGFEIVQSIFPDWTFLPADTVAAYGLHGALFIGPRQPVADRLQDWRAELAMFEIDLFRNGAPVDHGHARNVLDGPVSALKHLVSLLGSDDLNPPLEAGEIVSTGTLTRAFPAQAGEEWTTRLAGVPLAGARISFA